MGYQQLLRRCCGGSLATSAMLGVLVMLVQGPLVEGRRMGETCDGSRALGDKWFDGCHWCVCTLRGVHCSSSDCSGLVERVPPCHKVGQKWNDGCYRCRCKRHGITCRMDTTCLLLRHHPVPCLADNRCVCGPDGVPSCTAEVIDRHAFSARRVDLGFPTYLAPDGRHDYPDFRRGSNEIQGKVLEEDGMSQDEGSSSQELLIMSDNMCRFGSRWYGGSLRCFCDIDGSITCGDPTFVTAFIDNFLVQRQECEEGHVWEEGCSVCSCRRNGVIFCRRSSDCRHQFLDSEEEGDASDDDILGDLDHYLPVGWNHPSAIPEPTSPVVQTPASTSARVPMTKGTRRPALECVPGKRWHEGCARCHCSRGGRVVCSRRLCHDKDEEVRDEVSREAPQGVTDKNGNDVRDAEVTMWNNFPRGPRGPMMLPPRPASIYHPPAYMAPPKHNSSKCGKFDIGEKYWQNCNLCLCTRRGPKCQAKLCR